VSGTSGKIEIDVRAGDAPRRTSTAAPPRPTGRRAGATRKINKPNMTQPFLFFFLPFFAAEKAYKAFCSVL